MFIKQLLKFTPIFILLSCNESKEHYNKAYSFFNNNNYKESLIEIDKAEKLDTTNLEYKFLKAKIFEELKFSDDAIQLYKSLIKNNFKIDTLYYNIGQNYFELVTNINKSSNDDNQADYLYKTSIKYLDSAIMVNKYFFNCYELKYKILHNLSLYKEAIVFLNQSIKIFKDSIQLKMFRGVEKGALDDNYGGIIDLDNAICSNKLNSQDVADAYRFKGAFYDDLGKFDSSIESYNKSILNAPYNNLSHFERGCVFFKIGQVDKACLDFRESSDLGNTNAFDYIKKHCQ